MSGELKTGVVQVGQVVVCSFAGDLHRDTEDQARAVLEEGLGFRPRALAVDLSGVELFSSSGLNALLTARRAAAGGGVATVLIAPSEAVRRVLELTDAATLFPVVASAEDADRHGWQPPPSGA